LGNKVPLASIAWKLESKEKGIMVSRERRPAEIVRDDHYLQSQSLSDAALREKNQSHPPLTSTWSEYRKTVLFITRDFPPDMQMGARACAQIARHLPLYGWTPIILTGRIDQLDEEYLEKNDSLVEYGLKDAVIRSWKFPHPLHTYAGIKSLLMRLKSPKGERAEQGASGNEVFEKAGLRRLILSILSAPDKETGWIIPAVIAGLRAIRRESVTQLLSSGPCWTNHLVAYLLSRLTGLPWAAHFRDPWAAGYPEHMKTWATAGMNSILEKRVVSRANVVVSVTEEHTEAFRKTYPRLPGEKFITIFNGYDGAEWPPSIDDASRNPGYDRADGKKLLITYAGKLYHKRSPIALFRVIRSMIESGELSPDELQVDLVGWCERSEGRSVADLVEEYRLSDCVNLVGSVSRAETIARLTRSDLLLLLAEELTLQIPGKTFEYLRAGRPILTLTSAGSVANLMKKVGGGWVVEPGDDDGVRSAIRERVAQWRAGDPGPTPDRDMVESFDRRALTGRLAALFAAQPARRADETNHDH
jgi:glycosyltransferase involved in cell wall biosynthesis